MQLSDLQWNTEFTSTILLHKTLLPNTYKVSLTFNSNTDNIKNQNRAFDRIKYFFQVMMHNGLIMNYKNEHAKALAEYSDKIAAFIPKGKISNGTMSTIKEAQKIGKKVVIIN